MNGCCPAIRSGSSKTAFGGNEFSGWAYHVNMRLVGQFIARALIFTAVDTFELVEAYPDDKYLPRSLLLGSAGADGFHALFAVDVRGDNVRVVTAYRPDAGEWREDLKARRPRR